MRACALKDRAVVLRASSLLAARSLATDTDTTRSLVHPSGCDHGIGRRAFLLLPILYFLERLLQLARESVLHLALAHLNLPLAILPQLLHLLAHVLDRMVELGREHLRLLLPGCTLRAIFCHVELLL